jgi:hypothetical protein
MKVNHRGSFQRVFAVGLIAAGLSYAAIVPTFEPAGVQAPIVSAICAGTTTCVVGTYTFDSWPTSPAPLNTEGYSADFTTDFGTGGLIDGTYTGGLLTYGADEYGGAGGTGLYPEIFKTDGSYTLALSTNGVPGVNYFGLWFSALDAGNLLQFYSGSTLLYTFTPADFITLVGACNGSNQFCGNPNYANHMTDSSADNGEQFAFLNFFDTDPAAYITSIVFSEPNGGGGFESDNHTVAYIDPITVDTGTQIYGPEPSSFGLFVAGGILVALRLRRRRGAPPQVG